MEEETFADRLEMAVTDLEKDNWYAWLHHGVIQLQKRRFNKAREALERSCQLRQNAWALYGLSVLAEWEEDLEQAGILAAEAFRLLSDNLSLAKAAMQRLCAAELYAQALELDMHIPEKMRSNGRLTFYRACALAHTGELDRALALLNDGDGLTVDDTRESETSLCDLWSYIREKQKTADLDESPPYALDFRMSVKKG